GQNKCFYVQNRVFCRTGLIPAPRSALLRHVQLSSLVPAPRAAPAAPRAAPAAPGAIPFQFSLVSAPRAGMSVPRADRLQVL
ncbi:hypothetical protein A2U01_0068827, partial [Trifolium medium]|nr:hypothetical protein [Trifolium medium]